MPMRDLLRALSVTVVLAAGLVQAQAFFTPDQISNDYSFLREGENVRLDVQGNQLRGYVNAHGSSDTDSHLILAMFFQKATLDGNKVYFMTKPVHGVRYEFSGQLASGEEKADREGRIVLRGELTQYLSDSEGNVASRKRSVEFKSFPQDTAH